MKSDNLIIMAAGASSRMKRSLNREIVDSNVYEIANNSHKSLIPLGRHGRPLIYYLIKNAIKANYSNIYIITGEDNNDFKQFIISQSFKNINIQFVKQYIPKGREKPLGTSDAVVQALDQFPELKTNIFTVCNGDNLYSVNTLNLLKEKRNNPHALISYSWSAFNYEKERISKFAVISMDSNNNLKDIVEKPDMDIVDNYKDKSGEIGLSMNIFSFTGSMIYSYVKNCPINEKRNEKELPEAVRVLIRENPNSMFCYKVFEHLPDLTNSSDIENFKNME
ncbi:MAG: glucose-1-phosphate thymidylyltransferase [Flavobacteriaceae bacterium]|nr:glucose-1-phosphate thymidylyltransferase [Flavobacteriaceae bacterium]|tara:strand:- start:687 stop:1523 length:837 start_codon:yes stop_codon:yes gene_type:complete